MTTPFDFKSWRLASLFLFFIQVSLAQEYVFTDEATLINNNALNFRNSNDALDGTRIIRYPGEALRIQYNANAFIFDALDNKPFYIRNATDENLFKIDPIGDSYLNVGNVGIGLTNPSTLLHVKGDGTKTNIFTAENGGIAIKGGNSTLNALRFDDVTGEDQHLLFININNDVIFGNKDFDQIFFKDQNAIFSNASVGIGTEYLPASFNVVGQVRVRYDASTTDRGSIYIDNNSGEIPAISIEQDGTRWWQYVESDNTFNIGRGTNYNSNLATLSLWGDKVGIGTSTPSTNLHIKGDGTHSDIVTVEGGGISIRGGNSTFNALRFDDFTGVDRHLIYVNANNNVSIGNSNFNELHFKDQNAIFSNAFVGIGTDYLPASFNVVGQVRVRYDASTTTRGSIYIDNVSGEIPAISIEQDGTRWWQYVESDNTFRIGRGANYNSNSATLSLWADNVGIGITKPNERLEVDGHIRCEEVTIEVINAPDYVFEPDYELITLKEIQDYIKKYKHLPEIPSAVEMECNGVDLGEMNMALLKKIEEMTLYQIDLMNRLEKLEADNARMSEIEKKVEQLMSAQP